MPKAKTTWTPADIPEPAAEKPPRPPKRPLPLKERSQPATIYLNKKAHSQIAEYAEQHGVKIHDVYLDWLSKGAKAAGIRTRLKA